MYVFWLKEYPKALYIVKSRPKPPNAFSKITTRSFAVRIVLLQRSVWVFDLSGIVFFFILRLPLLLLPVRPFDTFDFFTPTRGIAGLGFCSRSDSLLGLLLFSRILTAIFFVDFVFSVLSQFCELHSI